jgi:hypothetical protein
MALELLFAVSRLQCGAQVRIVQCPGQEPVPSEQFDPALLVQGQEFDERGSDPLQRLGRVDLSDASLHTVADLGDGKAEHLVLAAEVVGKHSG